MKSISALATSSSSVFYKNKQTNKKQQKTNKKKLLARIQGKKFQEFTAQKNSPMKCNLHHFWYPKLRNVSHTPFCPASAAAAKSLQSCPASRKAQNLQGSKTHEIKTYLILSNDFLF